MTKLVNAACIAAIVMLGAVAASPPPKSSPPRDAGPVTSIHMPGDLGFRYKPGPGSQLANAYCLTCHSSAYVSTQPVLDENHWTLEVTKMVKVYGASVPDKDVAALAAYLAREYGVPGAAAVAVPSAAPNAGAGKPRGAGAGEAIYATNCIGCHGANGTGQAGIFPSLVANTFVSGDAKKLIHTVKYGLSGPIVSKGVKYDGDMPAWKGTLSDAQIADVITYIRTTWGNKGSAVSAAEVGAVAK